MENNTNITFIGEQCSTKWKGLVRTYKDIKSKNEKSGSKRSSWPYYDIMNNILYSKPEINPVATCSSTSGLIKNNDKEINEVNVLPEPPSQVIRKRKTSTTADRHTEKMQRVDRYLDLTERLVTVFEKKYNQN